MRFGDLSCLLQVSKRDISLVDKSGAAVNATLWGAEVCKNIFVMLKLLDLYVKLSDSCYEMLCSLTS